MQMLEMPCPEYFATHLGRVENAGGGNLRLFMCIQRGIVLEPVYTVVIPAECLPAMAASTISVATSEVQSLATAH